MVTNISEVQGTGLKQIGFENTYPKNPNSASALRQGLWCGMSSTTAIGILQEGVRSIAATSGNDQNISEGQGMTHNNKKFYTKEFMTTELD